MNGTILQGFSWYLPADGSHWRRIAEQAPDFAYQGITAVWLPPAYKAEKGAEDVVAREVQSNNREAVFGDVQTISAWTRFDFPGRAGAYSDFTWD